MTNFVSVQLSVGIPSEVVHFVPVPGSGGTFNGGVKCEPSGSFNLDITGRPSLSVSIPDWGITHRYNPSDGVVIEGMPNWFRRLRPGAVPIESQRLLRTTDNLNVTLATMTGATHALKFMIAGGNPLLSLQFGINADITVGLRKQGTIIQYCIIGDHDGFPDYRITINGKTVYYWDCVANSEDPSDLMPPAEHSVLVNWTNL